MSQYDFIKDLAKYGLENDQDKLLSVLNELIDYSKQQKKVNFAIQLQSILRDAIRQQQTSGLVKFGSMKHQIREEDREVNEFILEKLTSDYRLPDLVCRLEIRSELEFFIKEQKNVAFLRKHNLPVSNKLLLHGPSGCGKTLAAYVLAGELEKMLLVIDLGAIVSSKLGETSKNLSKIFKRASSEGCIIFLDEFDSLGKIRDYSQDHGEMKRVVNTLLQLFDYLPQDTILVAATNQKDMLDTAILRRFDLTVDLELPSKDQIKELVSKVLKSSELSFDNKIFSQKCYSAALGLSFYSIQKTLITSIKRSLFDRKDLVSDGLPVYLNPKINTQKWLELLLAERKSLNVDMDKN
ncbi:MAG: ATP-binding protein [Bacteroidota bacterium]